MASASSDESKEFSDGHHQDPKAEEEVISKAEEEEEDLGACSRSTIASIRVVQNPSSFKKSARITVGGCFPTHDLAEETPSRSHNNPYHTLIHDYQFQKVPKIKLPSARDIGVSNYAGKEDSEYEEG